MVEYRSQLFIWTLIALIAFLLAYNVYQLLHGTTWLPLLSILVQGAVLFALLKKTLWVKTIVRVWGGFVALSGLLPLFLAAPSMPTPELITSLSTALVGGGIYFLSGKYIDVDEFATP